MTNYLVVSNVALWVSVIALFIVVLALVRQVGILFERIAPAGALMINQVLSVGDPAPELSVKDENNLTTINVGEVNKAGKSQLIFFVSPDCPVCKTLLPVFKSASTAETDWLNCILASDGDQNEISAFIKKQDLGSYPFVNSTELGQRLGVSKLPYAVLIDAKGKIASMGLVNSREHFDSLFNAKESNVASLQDYLHKN